MSTRAELITKTEEAEKALKALKEAKASARALARATDLKKARESLKKYSADPTFKLLDSNHDDGWSWHKFEGPEENCLDEIRKPIITIRLYDGTTLYEWQRSSVSKSYRHEQKFYCVNGPRAGQWVLDKDPEYQVYNRARQASRRQGIPTAVLVHVPSIKEP